MLKEAAEAAIRDNELTFELFQYSNISLFCFTVFPPAQMLLQTVKKKKKKKGEEEEGNDIMKTVPSKLFLLWVYYFLFFTSSDNLPRDSLLKETAWNHCNLTQNHAPNRMKNKIDFGVRGWEQKQTGYW